MMSSSNHGLALRMEQPLDRCLVAPRAIGVEFGRRGAESGPAQQVSHEGALGIHVHFFTPEDLTSNVCSLPVHSSPDKHPLGLNLERSTVIIS